MSTQRGNHVRTRTQKHKNKTAFRNNLHDTSLKMKQINSLHVSDVCTRCKDIIEWKIKYKKYKPLSQPKTCVKCLQKTVKKAYHVMCKDCGKKFQVCTKCCQSKEIIPAEPDKEEKLKLDIEMQQLLQSLPERKRRTFLRYMSKKDKEGVTEGNSSEKQKDDLLNKLKALKVDDGDGDSDFDFGDSDDCSEGEDNDDKDDDDNKDEDDDKSDDADDK